MTTVSDKDIEQCIPGFTDPKKQPEILKRLANYAKSVGFKDEDIKNIRDRRLFVAMHKAMLYDQIFTTVNTQKGK